jgi:hypothetical protein
MDFDEWQRLAREDPDEFERRRKTTIEAVIEQAPPEHRQRLRALQSRIDLERSRAKTPLAATVRLQSMMWERFGHLCDALQALTGEPVPRHRRSARILPFSKPE